MTMLGNRSSSVTALNDTQTRIMSLSTHTTIAKWAQPAKGEAIHNGWGALIPTLH